MNCAGGQYRRQCNALHRSRRLVLPTCLIGSVMAGPWSQPRLQRIMVPKVDQTENPPPAHTSASDVLSGVHLYKQ